MQPRSLVRSDATRNLHSQLIEGSFTLSKESEDRQETIWLERSVKFLSEAISRRYCNDSSEMRVLEVVRNAYQGVLDKRNEKESTDYANYALGNH